MNHLWSPWRMEYIENSNKTSGCTFCKVQNEPDGPENLIIYRGRLAYVILNLYPYTNGHLMVVPFLHSSTIEDLSSETKAELMELTSQCLRTLRKVYHPEGFNVGINIGEVAGAGIAEHVHLHIVPRWNGDSNFMSTIGEVRVLPELLEKSYQKIKRFWGREGE